MNFILRMNTAFLASLLFIGLSFLSSGCNTTKKLVKTEEKAPEGADAFLLALDQNLFQAEWLTGSARLSYDDGSMTVGATASIKMQKDKVVWMSVKKFGFELGRAKITTDSIYILDRINNQYAVEPISYIEDKFQMPADLGMLQQILLGNPVFLTRENIKGKLLNDIYQLSASKEPTRNDYWFRMPTYRMEKMEFKQETEKRSLAIKLENYKDAGSNRDFSYLRLITMDSPSTGPAKIELEFSSVKINAPSEIKFSIPPRYTRMAY